MTPVQTVIEKTARLHTAHRRPCGYFPNARSAFKSFLQTAQLRPGEKVLLPSYIGWSPREGSGVFDPIAELGVDYGFYRLDERLRIDLDDLRKTLHGSRCKVLVLIHYFGYADPACAEACKMAREHGALVLEDEAHAMLSDLIGGACGRLGDACIYSLHKLLPLASGGMLVSNHEQAVVEPGDGASSSPWDFDLYGIAAARRRNAMALDGLLQPLQGRVDPLWGPPPAGIVPQTYPVLIRSVSRDRLYEVMNDASFGVVSLYHTLICEICRETYASSAALSRQMMNLPVHQDVRPEALPMLVERLDTAISALSV